MPTPPVVVWRDGVHVVGTVLWCDARRARDVCFVSSADRLGRAGHGQLIGTRETLAQLAGNPAERLPVPYHRPFTLGTLRIELRPSGHAVGAAMLLTEHAGQRIVYAGVVAPDGVGLGGPASAPACDVLVVAARYARPEHVFGKPAAARAQVIAWAQAGLSTGDAAMVLVTSAAHGLDVAAALTDAGVVCGAHRRVHELAQCLRSAGATVPPLRGRRAHPGAALIWLLADVRGRAAAVGNVAHRVALVSGLACTADAIASAGAQVGVTWSSAADRDQLLAFVRKSGARQVLLTGPCADDARAAIGDHARVLAPPRQLALWSAP